MPELNGGEGVLSLCRETEGCCVWFARRVLASQAALSQLESNTSQLREENSRLRARVDELSTHIASLTARQEETDGDVRLTAEQLRRARAAAESAQAEAEDRQSHLAAVSDAERLCHSWQRVGWRDSHWPASAARVIGRRPPASSPPPRRPPLLLLLRPPPVTAP